MVGCLSGCLLTVCHTQPLVPTQQDNERGRDLHCEPSPASKLMAGCYVAGWLVYLERLFCVTVFVYPAQVGGNLKGIALDQAVIRVCVCVGILPPLFGACVCV